MKLSGNSRGGKHTGNGNYSGDNMGVRGPEGSADKSAQSGGNRPAAQRNGKKKKKRTGAQRIVRVICLVVLVAASLVAGVMVWAKLSVKPPEVTAGVNEPSDFNQPGEDEDYSGEPPSVVDPYDENLPDKPVHDQMKFTFVVLGTDDGNGLADTIMVAMFDATTYKLNVMNIPRDTLVNVNGRARKVNEMYGASSGKTQDEKMASFKDNLANIIGFEVNFYAVVDLDAFKKLVDGIGGVDFYVPVTMKYSDPAQNLYIDISKGQKLLNGTDALKVVRFRNTYAEGDIKRIQVQQDFLMEAAKQVIEKKNSLKINTLADIFLSDVKTDLKLGNLVWFAKEMLKMDAENITFTTLPADYFGNKDYVIIRDVDALLDYVNENLNPFNTDITKKNVSIPTSAGGSSSTNNNTNTNTSNQGTTNSNKNPSPSPSTSPSGSSNPDTSTSPSAEPSNSPDDPQTTPEPTNTDQLPEPEPTYSEPPVIDDPPPPVETSSEPPPPTSTVIIPEE